MTRKLALATALGVAACTTQSAPPVVTPSEPVTGNAAGHKAGAIRNWRLHWSRDRLVAKPPRGPTLRWPHVKQPEPVRAPTTTTTVWRRPASSGNRQTRSNNEDTSPPAGGGDPNLAAIAECESGSSGGYSAQNPTSTASGKYQVLDSTWDGYGGYPTAASAPPAIQEQHAVQLYAQQGSRPWNASRGCWG